MNWRRIFYDSLMLYVIKLCNISFFKNVKFSFLTDKNLTFKLLRKLKSAKETFFSLAERIIVFSGLL